MIVLFIQNINRICLSNDTLFVLDSKLGKVVMFDMEGRCVGKIHNVGNGPREYIYRLVIFVYIH